MTNSTNSSTPADPYGDLIARARELTDTCCFECDGDGLMIIGWNENAHENIEGICDKCKGTGHLKESENGLIPDLANALEVVLVENERLQSKLVEIYNLYPDLED